MPLATSFSVQAQHASLSSCDLYSTRPRLLSPEEATRWSHAPEFFMFHITVPGLPENRPAVSLGDVVLVRQEDCHLVQCFDLMFHAFALGVMSPFGSVTTVSSYSRLPQIRPEGNVSLEVRATAADIVGRTATVTLIAELEAVCPHHTISDNVHDRLPVLVLVFSLALRNPTPFVLSADSHPLHSQRHRRALPRPFPTRRVALLPLRRGHRRRIRA